MLHEHEVRATLAAIERGAPGIYNVTDDEPTRVSTWLPALAAQGFATLASPRHAGPAHPSDAMHPAR